MNVTSEILFYLYSVKHPLIQEHTGLLNQPVTSIRRLVPGEEPDKEALYILTVDELKKITTENQRQKLRIYECILYDLRTAKRPAYDLS